jgi:Na+/glutamate symporter
MFVFYLIGAVISCGLIWPRSNLCGVVFPAMIAAPVGLVAGGIAGWLLARRLLRA